MMASVSCSVSSSDSGAGAGTGGVVSRLPHYTNTTKSRWSVEGEIMIHEEELSASRSHSRQKVKYLMEYLGSKYSM